MSATQRADFTPRQGEYLVFIRDYISRYGRAPSELEVARHFMVEPPSAHGMLVTLERRRLIARTPGVGRSIRLLIDPGLLPGDRDRGGTDAGAARLGRLVAEVVEQQLIAAGLTAIEAGQRAGEAAQDVLERWRKPARAR